MSRTTRRAAVSLVSLLAAPALLVGCSFDGGAGNTDDAAPAAASPAAGETPAPGQEALWPYYPHSREYQAIDEARAVLLVRCMEQEGFAVAAPATGKLDKRMAALAEEQSVLYGISDRNLVSRYGYSPSLALLAPPPAADAVQPLPAFTAEPPTLDTSPGSTEVTTPPAQQYTLCIQQAQAEVFGGQQYVGTDPFSLGRDLSVRAWLDSQQDPAVQSVWAKWRACMAAAGYQPPGDPVDPGLYPVRTDGSPAPAEEVAAALTDIDCKDSVDLIPQWSAVVRRLENTALEQHRQELENQRNHLAATLQRARAIVDTQP